MMKTGEKIQDLVREFVIEMQDDLTKQRISKLILVSAGAKFTDAGQPHSLTLVYYDRPHILAENVNTRLEIKVEFHHNAYPNKETINIAYKYKSKKECDLATIQGIVPHTLKAVMKASGVAYALRDQ